MFGRSCGSEYAATVKKLDLPTLRQLVSEAKHVDEFVVFTIAAGFRITGKLDIGGLEKVVEGGLLRKGKPVHNYEPDLTELWQQCEQINRKTVERMCVERPQIDEDRDLSYKVWEKTAEDVHCGRIGELVGIERFDLSSCLLCHRFAVWEARENGWRVRCIDNYFANKVNTYAVLPGQVYHDNLDHLVATLVWLARHFPNEVGHLYIIKTDFKATFKTLPVVASQRWLQWIAVLGPSRGEDQSCQVLFPGFWLARGWHSLVESGAGSEVSFAQGVSHTCVHVCR